jgi:hypothetical protein
MTQRSRSEERAVVPVEAIDGCFAPAPATVASVELDGETVLFDEKRGTIHELSRAGTLIWRCLDGNGTVDEIAVDMSEVFGVELARVQTELIEFVRELGRKGLLDNCEPTAP